jgi:hypothetical protein
MHAHTEFQNVTNGHACKTIHPIHFFVKETTTTTLFPVEIVKQVARLCNASAPYKKLKPPNNQNGKCSMKFPKKMNLTAHNK